MDASLIPSTTLSFLLTWGLIGCLFFFGLVVVLFRTGVVYTARKQDGTPKDEIPLSGKFAMLIIPNEMGRKSIRKHILVSLPTGLFLGLFLSIIPTTASYLLWMK